VESATVKDVIYAGVLTRYVVGLDAGGELVISRQNTQSPPGATAPGASQVPVMPGDGDGTAGESQAAVAVGARVRVSWLPAQAFTIPQREG
jgi:hypothetical protein